MLLSASLKTAACRGGERRDGGLLGGGCWGV